MKYKYCTLDMPEGEKPPGRGRYLVSIGRNTDRVNSVYQVVMNRKINSRQHSNRYKIVMLPAPDMKPFVHFNPANGKVWVKDQEEFTVVWAARPKKQKTLHDIFHPPLHP